MRDAHSFVRGLILSITSWTTRTATRVVGATLSRANMGPTWGAIYRAITSRSATTSASRRHRRYHGKDHNADES